MKKTISQTLAENKRALRHYEISLNQLRSSIMGDNDVFIICLEEYLREYYQTTLHMFMLRYRGHESIVKLHIEMKAKEMGLMEQNIKSFNL